MKNILNKIFKKDGKIIIGAIHFPPLLGYKDSPGLEIAEKNALEDLRTFEAGGADGIIIENNYDLPHKITVEPQTVSVMIVLGKKIKKATNLPIGVSVLWNDFQAAFSVAKAVGAEFIRIPVFVDKVETQYGIIEGNPAEVLKCRKDLEAENVAIFTDIHVKHAKLLSKKTIEKSALEAIKNKSDALIITGKWTGQAPDTKELAAVRNTVKDFPILVGSGADEKNIIGLLQYADGIIVGTSLKRGRPKKGETNVKGWQQRIDEKKVKSLSSKIKKAH